MLKKTCNKCRKELPASTEYFYRNTRSRHGLLGRCKECCREVDKNYYIENQSGEKERQAKYRRDNPNYFKEYRVLNKEKAREYRKEWKIRNPDYFKAWREKNKKDTEWMAKEIVRRQIKASKQRIHKKSQTPDLTQEEKYQMEMIYKRSQELGQDWQVDHIIPLSKGGLHHPDNLQIVTKKYNQQKGAKENFREPKPQEVWRI